MSIPGLGQDEPYEDTVQSQIGQLKVDTHEVQKEQEWRFEVAINRSIEVKVSLSSRRALMNTICANEILDTKRFG